MNPIPIKKLYNPQYNLLSISDKEELLYQIGEIYNLELISFKDFAAFKQSTYTAVYRSHDGIDFVFVPGDTVTLGFDFKNKPFQDIFNDENLAELAYPFVEGYEEEIFSEDDVQTKISETLEDEEVLSNIETYFKHNFTQEDEFVIHPLLVQKEYSETCWIPISDETLRQNKEWQQMIEKAESEGLSEIMIHNTICLYQTDDNNWYGKLYEETTFKELLQTIKKHGYSLPTRREWEYLAGKGCRTIFPWGNNIDFSMNLKHMEWMDNDGEYTLEKENFFGLIIGDDPYCREIVYDDEGFSYLERNPGQIDLIVMDLVMPVMDGFELIRRAQEHPLNKNIPILVIASSDRQEDIRKAFMLGADDVIVKPLEADIVKKRVNNMFDIADSRSIHNVMEDLVRIEIEENIESLGICPCPLCRRDLMTLALNNVPPKYVNTEKGAIMSKVGSMSSTERIKLLAEIARYAEMVRDHPRHAPVQSDIAQ